MWLQPRRVVLFPPATIRLPAECLHACSAYFSSQSNLLKITPKTRESCAYPNLPTLSTVTVSACSVFVHGSDGRDADESGSTQSDGRHRSPMCRALEEREEHSWEIQMHISRHGIVPESVVFVRLGRLAGRWALSQGGKHLSGTLRSSPFFERAIVSIFAT